MCSDENERSYSLEYVCIRDQREGGGGERDPPAGHPKEVTHEV